MPETMPESWFSRTARTISRSRQAKKGPNSAVTFKNQLGRNYFTAEKQKKKPTKNKQTNKTPHELKL